MGITNDLSVELYLHDVLFANYGYGEKGIKLSKFPTNFESEKFISEINEIWSVFVTLFGRFFIFTCWPLRNTRMLFWKCPGGPPFMPVWLKNEWKI